MAPSAVRESAMLPKYDEEAASRTAKAQRVNVSRERPNFLIRALRMVFNPRQRRINQLQREVDRMISERRPAEWNRINELAFSSHADLFRGNRDHIDDALHIANMRLDSLASKARQLEVVAKSAALSYYEREQLRNAASNYRRIIKWLEPYARDRLNPLKQAIHSDIHGVPTAFLRQGLLGELSEQAGISNNIGRLAGREAFGRAWMNSLLANQRIAQGFDRLSAIHSSLSALSPEVKSLIIRRMKT